MSSALEHIWHTRERPEQHGCAAAQTYLSLLLNEVLSMRAKKSHTWGEMRWRRANDILRACRRDPLPASDPGVHKNLLKLVDGLALEPVMLVRWSDAAGGDIADGYHRVSTAYLLDPFCPVACFELGASKGMNS